MSKPSTTKNQAAESYAVISATGLDAFSFLQGQLSADLRRLRGESPLLAAWCNPKGRVITLMRVTGGDDGYRMALPNELAESVLNRLTMFRFRAKVELGIEAADPVILGIRDDGEEALRAWQLDNLRNGVPEILSQTAEEFTPHMLNLDRLDAISLDKGCYTGQEVVARTHYRGATKRRMLRFTSEHEADIGDEVMAGDRKVGEVVNAIGNDLLAVLPLAEGDEALTIGDALLTREALPYTL